MKEKEIEGVDVKFKEEKGEEGKEKKRWLPTPTQWHLWLPYCVGVPEIFQTPPWKALFGGWIAQHVPPGQCVGYTHAGT